MSTADSPDQTASENDSVAAGRVPVTVLTGFLGSGKTTLLNRILSEQHGRRIAVIENEFGEVGVDHELVIGAEEEIFEMNNGCICCTVRGDLIRILGTLMKRRDRFDAILIETTGLADPGPVAQTFFVDDQMQESLRLDGIVTLVDARHVIEQLDHSEETTQQIAFADVILINKIDLAPGPDPAMAVAIVPVDAAAGADPVAQLAAATERAVLVFSAAERSVRPGAPLEPGETRWQLELERPPLRFAVNCPDGGRVAVFTEHHPDEFAMRFSAAEGPIAPLAEHAYKPDHEHDDEVTSVGIEVAGEVDGEKLNEWLRELLATKGVDLYRMKGVLAIRGEPRRYVFQGVHMLLDHRPDRPWGDDPRENRMIFIGRNLDRSALTEGFRACLA